MLRYADLDREGTDPPVAGEGDSDSRICADGGAAVRCEGTAPAQRTDESHGTGEGCSLTAVQPHNGTVAETAFRFADPTVTSASRHMRMRHGTLERRAADAYVAARHTALVAEEPTAMKWFPSAFHDGGMSWRAQNKAIRDYWRHLADLRRRAPALENVAALNLHDAQVQCWDLTEEQFRWSLLIGDLQSGYQFAAVAYRGASLHGADRQLLASARLDTSADVELLSDELDARDDDGRFEHRFKFWPDLEFAVAFSAVDVALSPASSQDRRTP